MSKVCRILGVLAVASAVYAQQAEQRYVWFPSPIEGQSMEFALSNRSIRFLDAQNDPVTLRGQTVQQGAFKVFRTTDNKVYPILESTDRKLVALLGFDRWPNDYLGRLRDGGAWERLMSQDAPFATHGFAVEGGLVQNATSTPPSSAESLSRLFESPSSSWVSSANPVGTQIAFTVSYGTRRLYIANGFVNPKNLAEWEEYSRVRSLEIRSGQATQTVELADTPNFQVVNLSRPVPANGRLTLVIQSVHPGRRPAAALNLIIPVFAGREN